MNINRVLSLGILAAAGLSSVAKASDGRNAGSLLLYPEFDNRSGIVTIVTVTNVHTDVDLGTVDVEFKYIGRYGQNYTDLGCLEFNATETLTGGDTFTAITNFHNPDQEQGYLYVFAKNSSGDAITFNKLIGNVMTVDGLTAFEYSVNPVSYLGTGAVGTNLDDIVNDDGDGRRDLNGTEYTPSPDELLVPRFLGQGNAFNSELILIGLSGGTQFTTVVDFLIFNDNEEIFSSEFSFRCWARVPLLHISGIFRNSFLKQFTNQDPQELLGQSVIETGWFRFEGAVANSTFDTICDPSVYGVLVERIGNRGASDLPFEKGARTNGELISHDVLSDAPSSCD